LRTNVLDDLSRNSELAPDQPRGPLRPSGTRGSVHKPVVQPPTAYRDLRENPQAQAQAASYADLPWWQVFEESQLQELIRTALKQNYDLQLATERINAERAQPGITRLNLLPHLQGPFGDRLACTHHQADFL